MANVFFLGGTGHLGFPIAQQLVLARVPVGFLLRDLDGGKSYRQEKIAWLKQAGAKLIEGALPLEEHQLVDLLKGYNSIISVLPEYPERVPHELDLVKAAKQAGTIKRFFPANYAADYPREGPHVKGCPAYGVEWARRSQAVFEAVEAAGMSWTRVITYAVAEYVLPGLGIMAPPGTFPKPPELVQIYGDGTSRHRIVLEDDLGRVMARAVNDSRTENKKLIIIAMQPTQPELVAACRAVTGQDIKTEHVPAEQLEKLIAGGTGGERFMLEAARWLWVDNFFQLPNEEMSSEPIVYAAELYPDIKFVTFEEWYKSHAYRHIPLKRPFFMRDIDSRDPNHPSQNHA
ncbi:hypothetical protein WJX73_005488 [Symbiochloris irregularis]|uniref:NmrA-like domain-containing protein n=1 Tax=Symbiochloris irregularis TaxID=706552 RepID=A0AAW1PFP4_9CHLO